MSDQIAETISIKGLREFCKYDTFNPVEISIKSKTIIAHLNRYKNINIGFWLLVF